MAARLPTNFVKKHAAVFDNPLRSTATAAAAAPELSVVPPQQEMSAERIAIVAPELTSPPAAASAETLPPLERAPADLPAPTAVTAPPRRNARKPEKVSAPAPDEAAPLDFKFTARFNQPQWAALQTACHGVRIQRGQNITPAELLRTLVDEWVARGAKVP